MLATELDIVTSYYAAIMGQVASSVDSAIGFIENHAFSATGFAFSATGFEVTEPDGSNPNRFNGVFVEIGEGTDGRSVYQQQNDKRCLAWHNGCWRYYSYYDGQPGVSFPEKCTFYVQSEAASPLEIPPDAQWQVHESVTSKFRQVHGAGCRGASSFPVRIAKENSVQKQPVDFLVVGSSVAAARKGWSSMLRQELSARGKTSVNAATSGNNTSRTIGDLRRALSKYQPKVVIIGLSPANEGLKRAQDEQEARAIGRQFEQGSQALVHLAKSSGAQVVIGSVYPNQSYQEFHYKVLMEVYAHQHDWGAPVLEFLPATQDGSGRWLEGIWQDKSHPNQIGHRLMFEAIDIGQLMCLCDGAQQLANL